MYIPNPPVVFARELYINREYYISMFTILCKRHKKNDDIKYLIPTLSAVKQMVPKVQVKYVFVFLETILIYNGKKINGALVTAKLLRTKVKLVV